MKRLYKIMGSVIAGVTVFLSCSQVDTTTYDVKILDRPDVSVGNVHYLGNRVPLKPLNFIKLPVGDVVPSGWVREYLLLQKNGLTGKLGEISAWLEKNNNAWLQSGGDHGWEEVPYWLKGYGDLAYILRDTAMIAETKVWIEGAINSQQPNGYFGPVNIRNGKQELWANMIMLWCLQSYYEYSKDQRVVDLMTNYFKWQLAVPDENFLKDYWENSRGGDNLLSVYWLYNITGDSFLLDLAKKIHRNTANWEDKSRLPNWHNVNIAQSFREPASYYMLSGDSTDLEASYNVHDLVRRIFGQVPGGMFGADENARLAYIDPRQGTETCGFVEQMASDEWMLRITGDPFWADHCENVAFNSYPAAVMPDFKALRYITSPNHVISDSKNHHPGIDNSGPFLAMNPFSSRCCQHNHAQGWPYFAEHLVMASPDNGLAAVIYSACEAKAKVGNKGTEVRLTEETNYPFEESIRFTLHTPEEVEFPLYLRVPSWCENASLSINGIKMKVKPEANKYICVRTQWKDGDRITLDVPMHLSVDRWATNQNSASVNYGPLTYSLLIDEEYKKVKSDETAISDSRWQKGADTNAWPSYEIYPKNAWNYALHLPAGDPLKEIEVVKKEWPANNFPFTPQNVPILLKAKGRKIPSWSTDASGLCDVLPSETVQKSDSLESITLIPMGAARLRIAAFPVASK